MASARGCLWGLLPPGVLLHRRCQGPCLWEPDALSPTAVQVQLVDRRGDCRVPALCSEGQAAPASPPHLCSVSLP